MSGMNDIGKICLHSIMKDTASLISSMNDIGKIFLQYERYCEFDLRYEWYWENLSPVWKILWVSSLVCMILGRRLSSMKDSVSLISGLNDIGKFGLQYEWYCEFDLWYEWH